MEDMKDLEDILNSAKGADMRDLIKEMHKAVKIKEMKKGLHDLKNSLQDKSVHILDLFFPGSEKEAFDSLVADAFGPEATEFEKLATLLHTYSWEQNERREHEKTKLVEARKAASTKAFPRNLEHFQIPGMSKEKSNSCDLAEILVALGQHPEHPLCVLIEGVDPNGEHNLSILQVFVEALLKLVDRDLGEVKYTRSEDVDNVFDFLLAKATKGTVH